MKKTITQMKRIIALTLAFMMVITAVPQSAVKVRAEELGNSVSEAVLETESEEVVTVKADAEEKVAALEDDETSSAIIEDEVTSKDAGIEGQTEDLQNETASEEIILEDETLEVESEEIEKAEEAEDDEALEDAEDEELELEETEKIVFSLSGNVYSIYENNFGVVINVDQKTVTLDENEVIVATVTIDGNGKKLVGKSRTLDKIEFEAPLNISNSYGDNSDLVYLQKTTEDGKYVGNFGSSYERIFADMMKSGTTHNIIVSVKLKKVEADKDEWGNPTGYGSVIAESDTVKKDFTVNAAPKIIFEPNGGKFDASAFNSEMQTVTYYNSIKNDPTKPLSINRTSSGHPDYEYYFHKAASEWDEDRYECVYYERLYPIMESGEKIFDHWSIVAPGENGFEDPENDLNVWLNTYEGYTIQTGPSDNLKTVADKTVYAVYKEPKLVTFKTLGNTFDYSNFENIQEEYCDPAQKILKGIVKGKDPKEDLSFKRFNGFSENVFYLFGALNNYRNNKKFSKWAVEFTSEEKEKYKEYAPYAELEEVIIDDKECVVLQHSDLIWWYLDNTKDKDIIIYPYMVNEENYIEISPGEGVFDCWGEVEHYEYCSGKKTWYTCNDPNNADFVSNEDGKDSKGKPLSAYYDDIWVETSVDGTEEYAYIMRLCTFAHFEGVHWEGPKPLDENYAFAGWELYADDEKIAESKEISDFIEMDSPIFDYLDLDEYYGVDDSSRLYHPNAKIIIQAKYEKIGKVTFHSEDGSFDANDISNVKANYSSAVVGDDNKTISYEYKKLTNGYKAQMPAIAYFIPKKEGYDFVGWYEKTDEKLDISKRSVPGNYVFSTNAQRDYYPLYVPKMGITLVDYNDKDITFNIKAENWVSEGKIDDTPVILDNNCKQFGIVYQVWSNELGVELAEDDEGLERVEQVNSTTGRKYQKFGAISLEQFSGTDEIDKTIKHLLRDLDKDIDVNFNFHYGFYDKDNDGKIKLLSFNGDNYIDLHVYTYKIANTVAFHSEDGSFRTEDISYIKKNYPTAIVDEVNKTISYTYKKITSGHQVQMPAIASFVPEKEGYDFVGWYEKTDDKLDINKRSLPSNYVFSTRSQRDYYPLYVPKMGITHDDDKDNDKDITFNIEADKDLVSVDEEGNVSIGETEVILDNACKKFGIVYQIWSNEPNVLLAKTESEILDSVNSTKGKIYRKFGAISLDEFSGEEKIEKVLKLFDYDIDKDIDVNFNFHYGFYDADDEGNLKKLLSFNGDNYIDLHVYTYKFTPNPKTVVIDADLEAIDIVPRIGSKALKTIQDGDTNYCIVPHGSVVSFDVTAKDNCAITGYKVSSKASGEWGEEKNSSLNKVATTTFDITVKTDKKVEISSVANTTYKIEKRELTEGKWSEVKPVNGVYNVEDQAQYRVSYKEGAKPETAVWDSLSVITSGAGVGLTGDWKCKKDVALNSNEASFVVDAQENVDDYMLKLSSDGASSVNLSLHVLPGIKSVKIGGTKAVSGVQTATAEQDKKYVFPLTVAAISGKIASNTLEAKVYTYNAEANGDYSEASSIGDAVAEITSDMKSLYVTTPIDKADWWVEVIDTKNPNVKVGFRLLVETDAKKLSASKVAVAGSTDTDFTLTITNNQSLTPPLNGEFVYVISSQEVKNPLGSNGFINQNPVAIVPIEKDEDGKFTKTQNVQILNQYKDGAVEGLTNKELPQVKYDVKIVQLDKKLNNIEEEDTIDSSIVAESAESVVKSVTATPQPKAYATKITVAKKQTTLYNNSEEGQTDVLIASASFAKTVTVASLDKAATEALAPEGVTINVRGNDVYATIDTSANTPAGKYTITLQAVAEGKAIPAKATVDITVKEGELKYSLVPAATRIYKQNKKNATLKVKAVTPTGVKGTLKWSIVPTEDMGPDAVKRIAQYVKVSNGTVTVDAKYTQPAEKTDKFVVVVEGSAYTDGLADNVDYTTAKTEPIEINTDIVKIGTVILVDEDDNVYQMEYDSTTKKMVNFDIYKGMDNLSVKVLKDETTFKTGKFGGEDGYTGDDCLDESLYDLTIPKTLVSGTNPGTYKISAVGSITIKATANDGGKTSASTTGKAIYKPFSDVDLVWRSIFDVLDNGEELQDDDELSVYENNILIFDVDKIDGLANTDLYNVELKVSGGTSKKGTYFDNDGNKISYTGYQFKWNKSKSAFDPIKITVNDKSSGKSVFVKEITITNDSAMHVEAPAKASKLTATQNNVLYSGIWGADSRTAKFDLKNVPEGTYSFYVTYDPAKLSDAKYVDFWNACYDEDYVQGSNELVITIDNDADIVAGSYNLYITALDEELEVLSPATAITVKVTKPTPVYGKYTPLKKVTLDRNTFAIDADENVIGGPFKEVTGVYSRKNSNDTIRFNELTLADATINGRSNGFTDYFELDGTSIKIKDEVYLNQLKAEIIARPGNSELDDEEVLAIAYKESSKLKIPATAMNGFLTYDIEYGYNPDGSHAKRDVATIAFTVEFVR